MSIFSAISIAVFWRTTLACQPFDQRIGSFWIVLRPRGEPEGREPPRTEQPVHQGRILGDHFEDPADASEAAGLHPGVAVERVDNVALPRGPSSSKFRAVETEFARRVEGTGFARWTKPLGRYFVSVDTQAGERDCQRRRRRQGCFPRGPPVAGDSAGRELQHAGEAQHVNLYCAQPQVNGTYIQFQFETCHGVSARSTLGGTAKDSENRCSLIPTIAFATHSGGKIIPAKQGMNSRRRSRQD